MKTAVIIGRVVVSHYADSDVPATKGQPTPLVYQFMQKVCELYGLPFPNVRFVKASDVVSFQGLDAVWEVYEFHLPKEDRSRKHAYYRVAGGVADYLLSLSCFFDCDFERHPYKVPF